jgi:serine/threonine protein kinase
MLLDSTPTGPARGGIPSPKQVILESELQVAAVGSLPLWDDEESAVFELPPDSALAARIFARPTPELGERLAVMIANPPADPQAGMGQPAFVWPIDRLLQVGSFQNCIGYTMPWVIKARTLEQLVDPSTRLSRGPLFDFSQLVQIARRLASAFRSLHSKGHAAGPIRPSRVLIGDSGLVTLFDTTSFQVRDGSRVFPCDRGPAAYDAPEVQQQRATNVTPLARVERSPQHDAYTLGVLVYRLLTLGGHPLTAPSTGESSIPTTALPPEVRDLFQKCFGLGRDHPERRPDTVEWETVLAQVEAELVDCQSGTRHRYHRELASCPWCEQAINTGRDPFPNVIPAQMGTTLIADSVPPRRRTARTATGIAVAGGLEGTTMSDGIDDFELEADSSPSDAQPMPLDSYPPPELPPAMALEQFPPLEAPPAETPAAVPNQQRPTSFRAWLVGIIMLSLVANGLLLAYRQGWVSFPALKGKQDDSTPVAKKESSNKQAEGGTKTEGKYAATGLAETKPEKKNETPSASARPFLSPKDVLSVIQDDLYKAPPGERKYKRYFTVTHLHNDPRVTEVDLDLHRAALTGLLQHLAGSVEGTIVSPVDKARTVYLADLRRFSWTRAGAWREVLKLYPYGLRHEDDSNEELAELAREVYGLADDDDPAVRADWFIAAASEPPLKQHLLVRATGKAPPAIREVIARYRRHLDMTTAAAELGLSDAKALAEAIRTKSRLRVLEPLASTAGLPREVWSSISGRVPFQEAAKELDLGTPYSVR